MQKDKYTTFTQVTYSGRELLKKHSLNEVGLWNVYGEDPNCDFAGPHHSPYLGTFEGRLEDVIQEAVEHSGFWQWGAGGSIKKIEPVKVNPGNTKVIAALREQRTKLTNELMEVERKLLDMGCSL